MGGGGFNMAAIMASMAVGGAVGQNLAGTMGKAMSGINEPTANTPLPIPKEVYYVAVNGSPTGPFEFTVLSQMANDGRLSAESLVWKNGMAQWEKAGGMEALKALFPIIPPVPPVEK